MNADPTQIRQIMTITGVRLQAELRGECCLQLSEMAEIRKGLACIRSFGRPITSFGEMREAIAGFAVRATEKLRAEKLDAGYVSVFIQTNLRWSRPFGQFCGLDKLYPVVVMPPF